MTLSRVCDAKKEFHLCYQNITTNLFTIQQYNIEKDWEKGFQSLLESIASKTVMHDIFHFIFRIAIHSIYYRFNSTIYQFDELYYLLVNNNTNSLCLKLSNDQKSIEDTN